MDIAGQLEKLAVEEVPPSQRLGLRSKADGWFALGGSDLPSTRPSAGPVRQDPAAGYLRDQRRRQKEAVCWEVGLFEYRSTGGQPGSHPGYA